MYNCNNECIYKNINKRIIIYLSNKQSQNKTKQKKKTIIIQYYIRDVN